MGWEEPDTPHFCRHGMQSLSTKHFVGFLSMWAPCSCQTRLIIAPPQPVYPYPLPCFGSQLHFLGHFPEFLCPFLSLKPRVSPTCSVAFPTIPAHCDQLPFLLSGLLSHFLGLAQSTYSISSFECIILVLLLHTQVTPLCVIHPPKCGHQLSLHKSCVLGLFFKLLPLLSPP